MRDPQCLFVAIVIAATVPMAAQTPAPAPAQAAEPDWSVSSIKFSGLFDGYFSYNPNHPASGGQAYRNFDVKANQISLSMARIAMEHDADPIGFRIDLGFGRAYQVIHATEPAGDVMNWVPQAYVSFRPKRLKGTQFDFGKFYTSAGAELTEAHVNWNYSRSLLYAMAPYYHMGLRVTQPITTNFGLGFHLVNGWNNVEDNNTGKTIGITSSLTGRKASWFNSYYAGPEKTGDNKGFRHFYDTAVTWTPNDKASFYVNFDYGAEKLATGGSYDFAGIAGAARFALSKKWAISPRVEYYYDKDGFMTGTAQKLKEFTMTGEYKWAEGLLARLEYRRDWSDQAVLERGVNGMFKSQTTVTLGLVAFFAAKQ